MTARVAESTPGRRRALHALAAARRRNKARVRRGEQPVIAGKRVKISTYVRKYGKPKTAEAVPFGVVDYEAEVDILDREDVETAVGLVVELDSDPDDLRGYVAERARDLGCADLIPTGWGVRATKQALIRRQAEAFEAPVSVSESIPGLAYGHDATGYSIGHLNTAYALRCSEASLTAELHAIAGRLDEAMEVVDNASVVATYRANLEKRIRAGIVAKAVLANDGEAPDPAAVELAYQRHFATIVPKIVARASAALGHRPVASDELDSVDPFEEEVEDADVVEEAVGTAQGQSEDAPKYIFGRLNKAWKPKKAGDVDRFAKRTALVAQLHALWVKGGKKGDPEWDKVQQALRGTETMRERRSRYLERMDRLDAQIAAGGTVDSRGEKYTHIKARLQLRIKKLQSVMRAKGVKYQSAKKEQPVKSVKEAVGTAAVLSEAAPDGKGGNVFDVLVIQPGVSKNNRRYRREVLESSTPLLHGARSFASDGPDHDPRKRGVKALVGWWSDPRYDRKVELPNGKTAEGIVARYHVTDRDLASTLRESIEGGKPDLITFSIVADGEVSRVVESGRALVDVTKINAYESVDPVINAAAGGMAVRLVASVEDPSMDWAQLALPAAVRGLATGEITADDLEANRPDLHSALANGGGEPATGSVSESVAEALAPFQTERLVETVLKGHSRLPVVSLDRIRESATARQAAEHRVLTEAEVTAIVESETEYLKAIAPAVVTGSGPIVTDMKSEKDRVTEAMYNILAGTSNASFRAMYTDLTGDRDMTGRLQEGARITEAISTSTFAEILGDSITRRMLEVYRLPDLGTWRDMVNIVPVNDFRTQRRIRMGGYANLPAVAQGNPYTALTTPGDEEATYAPAKKGGTETVTMETIANDDLGAIRSIPTRLGRAAAQTLHEFAWDMIVTNPTIYDSVALFHASHNNLGSTALGASSLITARTGMMKQSDMSNSKRLGIRPKFLVVPIDLEQTAYELTQTDREVASANNTVNFIRQFGLTPVVVEYLTDTNNWFLVADKNLVPTIEMGFFNGREDPELFLQDMPNVGSVFSNDVLTYKIRHIYGGAVVDFRGFFGAVVA